MQTEVFGTLDGHAVEAVRLANGGLVAELITYGARLTRLWVPDASGAMTDVVLGFDRLQSYVDDHAYLGATCGQYANRIAEGRCRIDGEPVQLDRNEGAHHLHGGSAGFDRKIWRIAALDDHSVTFATTTEDGEMGFPGRSTVSARYSLMDDGALDIEMEAETDRPTLMNIVNHAYFNLAGSGDVLDHQLRIAAPFYTPVDDHLLATGEIRAVAGTPFDFLTAKPIGRDIGPLCPDREGGGYDHNWCLDGSELAAVLFDPRSGRRMELSTTQPGLQVYTGGFLSDRMVGKGGVPLCRFAGVALETQAFPCSPNHAHFPDVILRRGETYRHATRLRFSAEESA
ncbi:aldose epimerase family protein [Roseobacter sinensis]|uniref:Aldose 1-epimerase n=1 Tax=Roseobacter sinensis TaxID=2931391 RepID=A0ABT3BB28_9RHOB|nr:aldose epimerase family protein [Roseobacter sp. WL0113]MCV3270780.1 galactose mutarotase [Roseobacter sp. WL0113]